jgi:hypothetical protein
MPAALRKKINVGVELGLTHPVVIIVADKLRTFERLVIIFRENTVRVYVCITRKEKKS